jgi:trehalose-phosphatase
MKKHIRLKKNAAPVPKLLFLLDYDGTLTDFKKNPDHSRISTATRSLLYRLRKKHPVILVSGRYVDSLVKVSGLKAFPMIGTHGFEARNLPNGLRFASTRLQERFGREAQLLWKAVQVLNERFPGIHIEHKPFSSTLHFRGLPFTASQVRDLQKEFRAIYDKTITRRLWKLQEGKKMIEVMPKGFSKGRSVRALLKHFPGRLPLYAGDDLSDISVFKVLGKKGLKIAIGGRIPRKHRDLHFDSPEDFVHWLKSFV